MNKLIRLWIILILLLFCHSVFAKPLITIGSKKNTESIILGEILFVLSDDAQLVNVLHLKQLGGTRILWDALIKGDIDVYPEYTGTLINELLASEKLKNKDELSESLKKRGLVMTKSLGFANNYAIGITSQTSVKFNIKTISDLRRHSSLSFGFSNEFMNRKDGWPGLKRRYRLLHRDVRGMDHNLAYQGLVSGSIDVIDLYTTDAEIQQYDITVLEDNKKYFPEYEAVFIYRVELEKNAPEVVERIKLIENSISPKTMIAMNSRVRVKGKSELSVATNFVKSNYGVEPQAEGAEKDNEFWKNTLDHLVLVFISMFFAVLVAIPLGIISAKKQTLGKFVLGLTGIVQTIPALALLVFMIPLLGIGGAPAIVALFLYSLLPIVRNTYTALHDLPRGLVDSMEVLALPEMTRLWKLELPLCASTILAGIKIAAVINVGTATLGALIGAGGYGQPILTGIRLNDVGLILQGAIPAAVLALLVQGILTWGERFVIPAGLRIKH